MTPGERELLLMVAKRVILGIRTAPGYALIREIEGSPRVDGPVTPFVRGVLW
jgi:hypothetical protein